MPSAPCPWHSSETCGSIDVRKVSIKNVSTIKPKAIAPSAIDTRYATSVRLPKALPTTSMLAILVAGPAINSTSAAPGVIPFSTSASASGMEPVAQVYIGIASSNTTSMQSSEYSCKNKKKSSGTKAAIKAPSKSPIVSHLLTSPTMLTSP